ncbi:hypothetical protein BB561_006347 [Smittium simulii]|uniref:Myb/SANT-like DNA-binding domain-containing protein n=1 Tax=Smittium simulii TaxID=133385 RepID=A0A2T9Y525_9FUNG|nr:hypothetical protein BB561_006347 [Smittium simulii]
MSKIHKVQQDSIFETSSFTEPNPIPFADVTEGAADNNTSVSSPTENSTKESSESYLQDSKQIEDKHYPKDEQYTQVKASESPEYYNDEDLQDENIVINQSQPPPLNLNVEQVLVSYSNNYPVNNIELHPTEEEQDSEQFNKECDDTALELESGKDNILQTFHNAVEVLNEGQNRSLNANFGVSNQTPGIMNHDFNRSRLSQLNHDRLLSPKFNRSKNWCKEETFILLNGLIELTKDLEPQKREVMLRSNMVFDQISEKLLAKGYDRNTQACLVRWRNIIRIYKTQRRIVMEHGGEMKDHHYASEIEQIYGSGSNVLLFGDKDSNDEYNGRLSDGGSKIDESLHNTPKNTKMLGDNSNSDDLLALSKKALTAPSHLNKNRNGFSKGRGLSKFTQKSFKLSQIRKSTPSLSPNSNNSSHVTQSLLLPRPDAYGGKNNSYKNNSTPIAPAPNGSSVANVAPINLFGSSQQLNNIITPVSNATSKSNPTNYITSRPLDQNTLLDTAKWNPISSSVSANPFTIPGMSTSSQNYNSSGQSTSATEKKRKRSSATESEPLSRIEAQVSKVLTLLSTQSELTQKLSSELEHIKLTVETHKNQIAKLCEELEDKDMKRDQLQTQLMSTVQALSGVIANKSS